jgi:hypothetical protein
MLVGALKVRSLSGSADSENALSMCPLEFFKMVATKEKRI